MTRLAAALLAVLLALAVYLVWEARSDAYVIRRFHQLFYDSTHTWRNNTWYGIETQQQPLDVWITQEIISETKPDVIVECGAYKGGSAALWAAILKPLNPAGRIVSIDIEDLQQDARKLPIVQEMVTFLIRPLVNGQGGSTDPKTIAEVGEICKGKKVLVILDSDHSQKHVLNELRLYAPLVPVGGYIIVQDSNVNGHPADLTDHGPGPWEAVHEWIPTTNGAWVIDQQRERMLLTFNPGGYLKRVK